MRRREVVLDCVPETLLGVSWKVTLLDMGFTMSSSLMPRNVNESKLSKAKCKRKRRGKVTDCDTNLHSRYGVKSIRKYLVPRRRVIEANQELVSDEFL